MLLKKNRRPQKLLRFCDRLNIAYIKFLIVESNSKKENQT